jgi:hypothetical protein
MSSHDPFIGKYHTVQPGVKAPTGSRAQHCTRRQLVEIDFGVVRVRLAGGLARRAMCGESHGANGGQARPLNL